MKVLYCSHGKEFSGWGRAARDLMLALDTAGVDVVGRTIDFENSSYKPEGRLKEILEKDARGAKIVIQHTLPFYMAYDGHFDRNIAYFVAETLGWNASGWHRYINASVDELWCPNTEMAEDAKTFITPPINVVPHALDVSKFETKRDPLDVPELSSAYNFYFVGEWNRRKHLGALIQAFNLEFRRTEPVNLVLKVYKHGMSPQALMSEVQRMTGEVKKALKLTEHPNELIISSYMDEESLLRLHEACDCFVNPSYGEAWCYPAIDAMAVGNKVISINQGGPADFLDGYGGALLVDGHKTNVLGMNETFQNYNSGREFWKSIDIEQLRRAMRHAYSSGHRKSKQGLELAREYSYESVGMKMRTLLEGGGEVQKSIKQSDK